MAHSNIIGDDSCQSLSDSDSDSSYGSSLGSSVNSTLSTSEWKRENLEEINVFYAKDLSSLSDLFAQLRKSSTPIEFPTYVQRFARYAKEAMQFSIDVNEIQQSKPLGSERFQSHLPGKKASIMVQDALKKLLSLEEGWQSDIEKECDLKTEEDQKLARV